MPSHRAPQELARPLFGSSFNSRASVMGPEAYDTLKAFRQDTYKAKQALLGAIVVTRYNNDKTYRIDDINYKESPLTGKLSL